jgi:hypothetical protein
MEYSNFLKASGLNTLAMDEKRNYALTYHLEDVLNRNWEDDHLLIDCTDIFRLNDFECSENLDKFMPRVNLRGEIEPLIEVGDGLLLSNCVENFYDSVYVGLHEAILILK